MQQQPLDEIISLMDSYAQSGAHDIANAAIQRQEARKASEQTRAQYPLAPHAIESKALKAQLLLFKLRQRGIRHIDALITASPARALAELKNQKPFCFASKQDNHQCKGGTDSHRQLRQLEIDSRQGGAKCAGFSERLAQQARLQRADALACNFYRFEAGAAFLHIHDGKKYRASGDVWACYNSGKVHICTPELCDHQVLLAHDEHLACSLTHKVLGTPYVAVVERSADGGDTGRDGSLSYHASAGRGGRGASIGDGYHTGLRRPDGSRSTSKPHDLGGRKRRAGAERAQDRTDDQMRLKDPMCCIKRGVGKENEGRSALEVHFSTRFTGVPVPVPRRVERDQVDFLVKLLLYDGTVRRVLWEKFLKAEQHAITLLKAHYREAAEQQEQRDMYYVVQLLVDHLRPLFHRLQCHHAFIEEPVDHNVVRYFTDLVVCTWQILHYTPFARRSPTGFTMQKHTVGILYKLQTGFSVNVTFDTATRRIVAFEEPPPAPVSTPARPTRATPYQVSLATAGIPENDVICSDDAEPIAAAATSSPPATQRVMVCFLPRHEFLDRLPQKNDLNRFDVFSRANVSSTVILETHKFLSECYESLLRLGTQGLTIDSLQEFTLERYINVRSFSS